MDIQDLSSDLLPAGATPLHLAANNNDVAALKLVIESDQTSVDIYDSHGRTPLVAALQNGRLNAAVLLIRNGARLDVRYEPPTGLTVSEVLSRRPAFSKLIDSLVENDIPLPFVPSSLLPVAAYEGKTGIVRVLVLQYGVAVDHVDNLRRTALHYASQRGDLETVCCLIQLGASHTFADLSGSTPLHLACAAGHQDVVQALLEGDGTAGLGSLDACQRTPALVALYNKRFDLLLYFLTSFRSLLKISQVDKHGHSLTTLLYTFRCRLNAIPCSHDCLLPCLSKEEASWFLFEAVSRQDSQLVSFSLSQGASVDSWDYLQQTPLLFASKLGSLEVCRVLVDHGADPNVFDHGGRTPLQYAAEHDNLSVVEFLLCVPSVDTSRTYVQYSKPLSVGVLSVFISFFERNPDAPKPKNWLKWLSLAAPYGRREAFMAFSEAVCPTNWVSSLTSQCQSNKQDVHSRPNTWPTLPVYDPTSSAFKALPRKRGHKPPRYTEEPFTFAHQPSQCFYPLHEAAVHGNADVLGFILSQAGNQRAMAELLQAVDDQGRTVLNIAARNHSLFGVLDQFYLTSFVAERLAEEYGLPEGVSLEEALLHLFMNG